MYRYNKIFVDSKISKIVLNNIITKKSIDFKNLKILHLKKKILILKKNYFLKKKNNLNYKYQVFWNIVEEKYNKKINIVKRSQKKKEEKFNIIYSDFSKILGFLPNLLTLLIFDNELKKLFEFNKLFLDLKKAGDLDEIKPDLKISFINKLNRKISIITPLCPDYEHVYIGLGLYKYTFNKLNSGLGLIGKRLTKTILEIHKVLKNHNIIFEHAAYYGDFESYSKKICERVGESEKSFIKKLNLSSKLMKKNLPNLNQVGLLVNEFANKEKWLSSCKKNEQIIMEKFNSDSSYKKTILNILDSRMDLYKSWYPKNTKEEYLKLLIQQGAEYATMGDLFFQKIKNPVVFGFDHPKMGFFYNLNVDIPVLYARPKYL